jgi:hypothetical protein
MLESGHPFYVLQVRDPRYSGRIVERLATGAEASDERYSVRVVGLDHVSIHVKPTSLKPLADEDVDECPVCMDPLCHLDATLMCGHRLHSACLAEVRNQKHVVSCPMCRDTAGEGGTFVMDWAKRPALEVVASGLSIIFQERSKTQRSQKASFTKAKEWAHKRCKLLASNRDAMEKVVLPMMKQQQTDALRIQDAKGKPVVAKFPLFLASATACALPDASWEPEFRRYLKVLVPGQNTWEVGREHLTVMLEWQL